jgi:hypothetical protein
MGLGCKFPTGLMQIDFLLTEGQGFTVVADSHRFHP